MMTTNMVVRVLPEEVLDATEYDCGEIYEHDDLNDEYEEFQNIE